MSERERDLHGYGTAGDDYYTDNGAPTYPSGLPRHDVEQRPAGYGENGSLDPSSASHLRASFFQLSSNSGAGDDEGSHDTESGSESEGGN